MNTFVAGIGIADGTTTGAHFLVDPRLFIYLFILFLKVKNKVLFSKVKNKITLNI